MVAGWKASREAKAAREAAAREARLASARAFVPNAAAPAFVPSVALPPAPPVQALPAPAPAPADDWGELPEAFTAASEWFGTAKRWRLSKVISGARPQARIQILENLVSKGRRHILAVQARGNSLPPGSSITVAWRCLGWKYEISCWDVAAVEVTLHALRDARIWVKIPNAEQHLVRAKQYRDEARQQLERFKPTWLKQRAIQRKKRTCSMCGKTAPISSRAFDYCGGCRHSAVPRVDRPRYCSEECQRAHWHAGHMNECPSCTG